MTGRAILREVASRAAASVMMQMDAKARTKDLPGVKTGVTTWTTALLDGWSVSDETFGQGHSLSHTFRSVMRSGEEDLRWYFEASAAGVVK